MPSMVKPRLSICIPTYNFGKFIGQALDSILLQHAERIEIVILDGGSTDDTERVVAQRQQNVSYINYHRQNYRGGIDRDIAKVISLAEGDYCWLFSADDCMKADAIGKMLNYIQSNYDIYLCEHTICDYNMQPVKEFPIFNQITAPETFRLGNTEQRLRYFSKARTSEAFFSFLSGPVFRRDLWEKSKEVPESFYGTCWALAGHLLSLVPNGLMIRYLAESLIFQRGGNDSFLEYGKVHRLRISVEGFAHISETIFGKDSPETHHIKRVIRNERHLAHLLGIKLSVATSSRRDEMKELNQIVFGHYSEAGILNMCKYLIFRIAPIPLLKVALILRSMFIKSENVTRVINV